MAQNVGQKRKFHIPTREEMEGSKKVTGLDAKTTFDQFRFAKCSPEERVASRAVSAKPVQSLHNRTGPVQKIRPSSASTVQGSRTGPVQRIPANTSLPSIPTASTAKPTATSQTTSHIASSSSVVTSSKSSHGHVPSSSRNNSSAPTTGQSELSHPVNSSARVADSKNVTQDDDCHGPTHTSGTALESAAVPTTSNKTPAAGTLIVSNRQRGNPLLKNIRNVPWEYGDIVADYVMGPTRCALFLSFRYHALNPNYIHERLKQLGHSYELRVLLAQIDVKDPHHTLKELAKICILADCTLILAWSPEEAGRYLETYKSYENKPADLIMEKTDANFVGRVTDCLTTVKKVNKTDAATLLSTFETMENIFRASEEDVGLCPGIGPQKAKRFHDAIHEPFLRSKKKKKESAAAAAAVAAAADEAAAEPEGDAEDIADEDTENVEDENS